MRVLELPAVSGEIANALDFISNSLAEFGVRDKTTVQNAMLATEESLVKLIDHTYADKSMEVSVKKGLTGVVSVNLAVPGSLFDFYKDMGWHDPVEVGDADTPQIENEIRGTILTSIDGDLRYENKKGINCIHVILKKPV